jgi:ketosteroid isomerase-like protein
LKITNERAKIFRNILALCFMKSLLTLIVFVLASLPASAQSDLEKIVGTERAFASLAADKGTKDAFLANLADDGLVFVPDRINGKQYWNSRDKSSGLLSWAPNYADVSSNGLLGYTTGNWEYRAKGKDDTPSAFGEFITVWQRMPDGNYKFVVDIGVSHDRPANFSTDVAAPSYPSDPNSKNASAADTANQFFEMTSKSGISSAYKTFAAENVRGYREGGFPILGKSKFLSVIKKNKGPISLAKRSVFFQSADIAYNVNTYTETKPDGTQERGNFMQIWKFINGRWQIVLDVFKPVPQK